MKTRDRLYSNIAAICFLFAAAFSIIICVSEIRYYAIRYSNYDYSDFTDYYSDYIVETIILCIIQITFAAAIFCRKCRPLLIIASITNVAFWIGKWFYWLYTMQGSWDVSGDWLYYYILEMFDYLINIYIAVVLFVIILIKCSSKLIAKRKLINDWWIFPAVFLIVEKVAVYFSSWVSVRPWFSVLPAFAVPITYFFAALWLKSSTVVHQTFISGNHGFFNSRPVHNTIPVSKVSVADQLIMLKQLLDTGAITQWEYDAKKKQILGL